MQKFIVTGLTAVLITGLFTGGVAARVQDPIMQTPPGNPVVPLVRRLAQTPAPDTTTPAAGTVTSTRFKPTGKRIFLPKLVNRLAKNSEGKKALTQMLEDGLKAFDEDVKEAGVRNDVGAAVAYFISSQWSLYNGDKPVPETAGLMMVVQAQRAMDGPELKKATDAQKQEFYEWCVCTTTLTLGFYQAALDSKNDRMRDQIRKAAGDGLRNLLDVEPERVSLNDKGLIILAPKSLALVTPADPRFPRQVILSTRASRFAGRRFGI